MLQLIANALGALKEMFGFANKRTDLKNAPKIVERAEAQKEIIAVEKTNDAIHRRDLDELRREGAE